MDQSKYSAGLEEVEEGMMDHRDDDSKGVSGVIVKCG
jgi:hypothetical protein